MAADLIAALARAELAASLGIAAVFLLRGPVRRSLGARAAYALWLVPALAAVASLLPARVAIAMAVSTDAASSSFGESAARVTEIISAPAQDWSGPILWLWVIGVAASIGLLTFRQLSFLRGLGRLHPEPGGVWRAQASGFGPAVVGSLAPKIVVPNDFEARFSAEEREVVLAHERAHLRSGDALVNLAMAVFQCLSWFNPLVHLAAHRLRLDQELACDAAVVARFPTERKRYAETMLKTQLAPAALPLGCYWPARSADPLKERIRMLKSPLPGLARKLTGGALVMALSVSGGYAAWAAQPARTASPAYTPPLASPFAPDDVNAARPGDGTPLIIAAKWGDSVAIRKLLAQGADPNLASRGDGNPLITAAAWGNVKVADVLVAHGAEVNANVVGDETPLINAAAHGHLNMVRFLVAHGADVNLAVRKDGNPFGELRSPLGMARRNGHDRIVAYLLKHGAKG